MDHKIAIAQKVAARLYEDVVDVKYVKTHKAGEEEFVGGRRNKAGQLIITINPNGLKATVEWKGRLSSRGSDFRIFRIEDYPTTDEVPAPAPKTAASSSR